MIESTNKEAKELRKKYPFLFGQEFDNKIRKEYGNSDNVIPTLKAMQVKVDKQGNVVGDDLGTYSQLEDFALQEKKKDKPMNYLFEAKKLLDAGFFKMLDMNVVSSDNVQVNGFFKRLRSARIAVETLQNETVVVNGQTISKHQHLLTSFPTINIIHTHIYNRIITKTNPRYLLLCRELDALGIIDPLAERKAIEERVGYFLCNDLYFQAYSIQPKVGDGQPRQSLESH